MSRIQSLDLARGFTVLCIPAIHSVMCFSQTYVYTTWLGYPLQFIAEGPGAQLFMTIMGVVFTFKKRYEHQQVFIRAFMLAIAGYLLNILKFIVPYAVGVLPIGVQHTLQLRSDGTAVWQLLCIGDILLFASIALVVIHLMYRLNNYHQYALALALLITVVSPLIWDRHVNLPFFNYLLAIAGGQPPRVFFPLFPWMVYPLLGLFFGKYLQEWQQRTFKKGATAGIISMLAGLIITSVLHEYAAAGFYRTLLGQTLIHIGIVLLALWLWHHVSICVKPNIFFQLIEFCSRNITVFYIIQWILICWLLPIIGYQALDIVVSFIMCACTTIFSLSLTYLYERFSRL